MSRIRVRRLRAGPLAAAATAVALAIFSATASAAPAQMTIFDPGGGYIVSSPGQRDAMLKRMDSAGVNVVRLLVPWRALVPSPGQSRRPDGFNPRNPGDYPQAAWAPVDDMVSGARARGMNVLLTPLSPIPDWASESGRSSVAAPEPEEFESFMWALGLRYSGEFDPNYRPGLLGSQPHPLPRVNFWAVYNEPNGELFLRPQYRNGRPYSGTLYRRLFFAAKSGLAAAGHAGDRILVGETAPGPGRGGVPPLDFLRDFLCLTPDFRPRGSCAPIEATGWSHHPYDPRRPPFADSDTLLKVGNIELLTDALRRAARVGATVGRLPAFVTEFGVQSVPRGVSLKKQVEYLGIAEYLLYLNRRIRSYAQYLMFDDPPSILYSFTTGLFFHGGAKKPSFRSFPMTLAVRRVGSGVVRIWGHVRPGEVPHGVRVVAKDRGERPVTLRRMQTSSDGYFTFLSRFKPGRRWMAIGRLYTGRTLEGTYVHAYRF